LPADRGFQVTEALREKIKAGKRGNSHLPKDAKAEGSAAFLQDAKCLLFCGFFFFGQDDKCGLSRVRMKREALALTLCWSCSGEAAPKLRVSISRCVQQSLSPTVCHALCPQLPPFGLSLPALLAAKLCAQVERSPLEQRRSAWRCSVVGSCSGS